MKLQHIIGADLSQESIDLFIHQCKTYFKIKNSLAGYRQMLKWFNSQKIKRSRVMIVMEHTGLYSYRFEKFLHRHQTDFVKVSALEIKRSMGLVRGKNDKIDAERIARYGFEKRDVLIPTVQTTKVLERLQMLHATRARLVKHRTALINATNHYRLVIKESDLMIKSQRSLIKRFTEEIRKIEFEINQLIKNDPLINRDFKLLCSIKGVGPVLASATIIKTGNFTKFCSARKLACYCGIAPFEHSSGKSIRSKTKVSHLADKELKTLLNLSAKSAIQHDKELKAFYERRIAMGKSKKSTINIVRNKILYRMFAVIERQTPFIENYVQAA